MNIIGCDPSLSSSGLCINGKLFNYCTNSLTKSGLKKWYALSEQYVTYRHLTYDKKSDNFTDSEVEKLLDYQRVTDMMMEDIMDNLIENEPIHVGIEGYSYSSVAGPLIDLVTFGTLLRDKLVGISDKIRIFPPTTLKKLSASMTYPPDDKGIFRRNGVSGGKFTKTEMYYSITENTDLTDSWSAHLRSIEQDVMDMKKIPKPQEDVNDAYLCYLVMKNKLYDDTDA